MNNWTVPFFLAFAMLFSQSKGICQESTDVEVFVRKGDDLPNRMARKGVRINTNRKRRTGWFGQPETTSIKNGDLLTISCGRKEKHQVKVDSITYIRSITIYFNEDHPNSTPIYTISGSIRYYESGDPVHYTKVCGYDDSGSGSTPQFRQYVLVDSCITSRIGDYSLAFPDNVEYPKIIALLDGGTCPASASRNGGPLVELSAIDKPDENRRIDIGIDDQKRDHILDVRKASFSLPVDLIIQSTERQPNSPGNH